MAVIVDAPIDALRAFLKTRVNAHGTFAADFRESLGLDGSDCLPVNDTFPCDPFTADGFADAISSGNVAFPILGVYRTDENWSEWTWEQDKSVSTVNLSWILPAHPDADVTWPILRAFVRIVRIYIQALSPNFPVDATSQYHSQRATDRETLKTAGVWGLAESLFRAKYGYDGPQRQAIYPTVLLQMDFHCKEEWDPSSLANWTSFEGKEHLLGEGQDGDAAPVINPLLTVRQPPGA